LLAGSGEGEGVAGIDVEGAGQDYGEGEKLVVKVVFGAEVAVIWDA
jgi:hypothetical protein